MEGPFWKVFWGRRDAKTERLRLQIRTPERIHTARAKYPREHPSKAMDHPGVFSPIASLQSKARNNPNKYAGWRQKVCEICKMWKWVILPAPGGRKHEGGEARVCVSV